MRPAAFAAGVLLAGLVAGVVALAGPGSAYGMAVGLVVAMPLLRAEAVGLPASGDPVPPEAGARALTVTVGALVVGVGAVFALDGSTSAGVLHGAAAAGAYLGSYALDLGLTPE